MMQAPHRYRLFGLSLASDLELPELIPESTAGLAYNLQIVRDPNLASPIESGVQTGATSTILSVKGVARYEVSDGCLVRVSVAADAPERNVRLFLLGSAMGLLLHQRKLLPLHANAIEIDGRAVAFMGESGAGKSTLAAWFMDQGHRIVADDVCVVELDEVGTAKALPGLPRLRLWRDVLQSTGRSANDYEASFVGESSPDKFDVLVASDRTVNQALPLAAVYLLGTGLESDIAPLTGASAFEALFAHTYRGNFLKEVGSPISHWQTVTALTSSVPIFHAVRSWGHDRFDAEAQKLLRHARTLGIRKDGLVPLDE